MSWAELQPIIRSAPRAKASISVTKAGAKLSLTLSETFFKELGEPKTADVFAGSGETAGRVLLRFGPKKKFAVTVFGKGGARIQMPIFPGIPDGARSGEACVIESTSRDETVIALPLASWAAQVKQAPIVPRKEPVPDPPAPSPNGKFDAEAYLKKKGHKITRLSSALFMIDGAREPIAKVLAFVNSYRQREQLRPLAVGEIE